jgi:hypothetical protein
LMLKRGEKKCGISQWATTAILEEWSLKDK